MDTLLHRLGEKFKGILEGFDRIVFKGMIKNICYPKGFEMFLHSHGVLNKDYKDWCASQSAVIIQDAENYSQLHTGTGVQYISSVNIRKETLAREQQERLGI